jgi:hypothetical protein
MSTTIRLVAFVRTDHVGGGMVRVSPGPGDPLGAALHSSAVAIATELSSAHVPDQWFAVSGNPKSLVWVFQTL